MMDEFNIIKRKRKKNAFASTALLVSIGIAVLAIILIVLLMGRSRTTKTDTIKTYSGNPTDATCTSAVKEEKFTNNLRTIKEAAVSYFTVERMPKNVGDSIKLTLKEMQEKKLVLDVYDSTGKKCSTTNSYVEVTKEENEYVMRLHLSCDDMEDYIIVHIGCYDFCKGKICEKEDVLYEYEYKKTVSCTMSDWSSWGEWKTKREATNSNKREESKTETIQKEVIDTIDATKKLKCPEGYDLDGDKCTTITTKPIPATLTYECPEGYDPDGTKCVKVTPVPAKVDYECPEGYDPDGSTCVKVTPVPAKVDYECPEGYNPDGTKCVKVTPVPAKVDYICPEGYKPSGTNGSKCVRTVPGTPVYGTQTVSYTCYKQECTTGTVFSCDNSGCGNKPVTTCKNVKKTCYKQEQYTKYYNCPEGYTPDGSNCISIKNATAKYSCSDGSKPVNKICNIKDTKPGTPKYSCSDGSKPVNKICNIKDTKPGTPKYSCSDGSKPVNKICNIRDIKDGKPIYSCPDGSKPVNKICNIKEPISITVPITYECPNDYTPNGSKCTKKIIKDFKVTYYRYSTRTCNGGSVSIKWSTDNHDDLLLNDGYVLTGNKRVIKSESEK